MLLSIVSQETMGEMKTSEDFVNYMKSKSLGLVPLKILGVYATEDNSGQELIEHIQAYYKKEREKSIVKTPQVRRGVEQERNNDSSLGLGH
jgi:hypothetical protein